MTREEAIDVLNKSIKAGSKVPWLTIVESVELAIQALSVSLPEGLDEAAGEYLDGHKPLSRYNWGDLMDAFKAGAEWQKAKMLEGAVEGKVFMSFAPGHNQMVMADVDLPTNTKVRIVVLKEED